MSPNIVTKTPRSALHLKLLIVLRLLRSDHFVLVTNKGAAVHYTSDKASVFYDIMAPIVEDMRQVAREQEIDRANMEKAAKRLKDELVGAIKSQIASQKRAAKSKKNEGKTKNGNTRRRSKSSKDN